MLSSMQFPRGALFVRLLKSVISRKAAWFLYLFNKIDYMLGDDQKKKVTKKLQ